MGPFSVCDSCRFLRSGFFRPVGWFLQFFQGFSTLVCLLSFDFGISRTFLLYFVLLCRSGRLLLAITAGSGCDFSLSMLL